MNTMVAYCGLDCQGCPIHLATIEPDRSKQQTMRVEIARMCSELYDMDMLPKNVIDCDGCRSEAPRLFSGCSKCEIRRCAIDKKLASCARCAQYACPMLLKHFESDPAAQVRLEELRKSS